jgi:GNAT superfamily N-acetyltransferase
MSAPFHRISDAAIEQLPAAAGIIGCAFADLDIAHWLMPGEPSATRAGMLGRQLGLIVNHALRHGHVQIEQQLCGVAVWLPGGDGHHVPDIDGYEQLRDEISGEHRQRFAQLDTLMAAGYPPAAHWHLALLAVLPSRHRDGIGTALLNAGHHLTGDSPTFLQASSRASRDFYLRRGYIDIDHPLLPDPANPNLAMNPMWRQTTVSSGPPASNA